MKGEGFHGGAVETVVQVVVVGVVLVLERVEAVLRGGGEVGREGVRPQVARAGKQGRGIQAVHAGGNAPPHRLAIAQGGSGKERDLGVVGHPHRTSGGVVRMFCRGFWGLGDAVLLHSHHPGDQPGLAGGVHMHNQAKVKSDAVPTGALGVAREAG